MEIIIQASMIIFKQFNKENMASKVKHQSSQQKKGNQLGQTIRPEILDRLEEPTRPDHTRK
jgi:hypothetical protein